MPPPNAPPRRQLQVEHSLSLVARHSALLLQSQRSRWAFIALGSHLRADGAFLSLGPISFSLTPATIRSTIPVCCDHDTLRSCSSPHKRRISEGHSTIGI